MHVLLSMAKRGLADVIKVTDLEVEKLSLIICGPNVITCPLRERGRKRIEGVHYIIREDVMMEAGIVMKHSHEARNVSSLSKGQKQGNIFSLEPPEGGTQLCRQVNIRAVR